MNTLRIKLAENIFLELNLLQREEDLFGLGWHPLTNTALSISVIFHKNHHIYIRETRTPNEGISH